MKKLDEIKRGIESKKRYLRKHLVMIIIPPKDLKRIVEFPADCLTHNKC